MEPDTYCYVEVQRLVVVECFQSVTILEIVMDAWFSIDAEARGECIFGTDGGQCGEQQALVADAFRSIGLEVVSSPIMGRHFSAD